MYDFSQYDVTCEMGTSVSNVSRVIKFPLIIFLSGVQRLRLV